MPHSEVIGDVFVQVPPDVVAEVLLAPIRLPRACDLEAVMVDQRYVSSGRPHRSRRRG